MGKNKNNKNKNKKVTIQEQPVPSQTEQNQQKTAETEVTAQTIQKDFIATAEVLQSALQTCTYPVGIPGIAWGQKELSEWRETQTKVHRSYKEEVLDKLFSVGDKFDISQYGALPIDKEKYPLFSFKTKNWDEKKPNVLVTGGVHGYETSGVQGAIMFIQQKMEHYSEFFNILVCPCVSPWGYECIQRWSAQAVDPNRSFCSPSPCDEAGSVVKMIAKMDTKWLMHVDLHETTDSDFYEFIPAKAARDGVIEFQNLKIPDGFYLIGDKQNPKDAWYKAIIDKVRVETHIAPADENGEIVGAKVQHDGVVYTQTAGTCKYVTGAEYCTTTEVYPDSAKSSGEECNRAQLAAVIGALDFLLPGVKAIQEQIQAEEKKVEEPELKPCSFYPIGFEGEKWGENEFKTWSKNWSPQRSYKEEVLDKLENLKADFDIEQYGSLSHNPERYPLFSVKTKNWDANKPNVLVTGGVHGYETSGVQGAILFLQTEAMKYSEFFNIIVCPCVSPWGYECIQRWDKNAFDPNRGFFAESGCEESVAIVKLVKKLGLNWLMHTDLHETTDSDATEFRRARDSRDGKIHVPDGIPDGFYLVADAENPQKEWHQAIINAVKKVTHIAPADEKGLMIGMVVTQEGVVCAPAKAIKLGMSVTNAKYATTTEVYPDSPKCTGEICNRAQVAVIVSALEFLMPKPINQSPAEEQKKEILPQTPKRSEPAKETKAVSQSEAADSTKRYTRQERVAMRTARLQEQNALAVQRQTSPRTKSRHQPLFKPVITRPVTAKPKIEAQKASTITAKSSTMFTSAYRPQTANVKKPVVPRTSTLNRPSQDLQLKEIDILKKALARANQENSALKQESARLAKASTESNKDLLEAMNIIAQLREEAQRKKN